MGLTGALSALPPARVIAVTSPKHLCPADEHHVHCRDFFTPVGVQWGLKDGECEWLNGSIASHNGARGNLWLVGQPSPVPCDRAGSACQPSCLPHPAHKGRDVLGHSDEEENSPWCTQRCLCCLTTDQPWCPQKIFCQWVWNYLQHFLNNQHNCQKHQTQFSKGK